MTATTQHTPGPLRAFKLRHWQPQVRDEEDSIVANVVTWEDAQLFAAAPDLLRELKDAVDCLAQASRSDGKFDGRIAAARAAIAKAEGRS